MASTRWNFIHPSELSIWLPPFQFLLEFFAGGWWSDSYYSSFLSSLDFTEQIWWFHYFLLPLAKCCFRFLCYTMYLFFVLDICKPPWAVVMLSHDALSKRDRPWSVIALSVWKLVSDWLSFTCFYWMAPGSGVVQEGKVSIPLYTSCIILLILIMSLRFLFSRLKTFLDQCCHLSS